VLILTDPDVRRSIDMRDAIEASAEAFILVAEDRAAVPPRHQVTVDAESGALSLFMPGFLSTPGGLGVKVVSFFPGNARRGVPPTHAAILLLDTDTGAPEVFMEATWLTSLRTGAGTGAATRWLARDDSRTLAVLGTGGLAYHQVEAVLTVRPLIDSVLLWNRTPARADDLADRLRAGGARERTVQVMATPERAVAAADIVVACTSARDPVVRGAWVRPGAHVNLVGAHGADMREGDDVLLLRSVVRAVDMLEAATQSGELRRPLAGGIADARAFVEVGAIGAGRSPGRRGRDEITWFKSVGIAAQDLATARRVLVRARNLGLGSEIAL
jgi:ornithine cyclodeaminase/alanine dehydrogenase-like protein (mu-crystallin family)